MMRYFHSDFEIYTSLPIDIAVNKLSENVAKFSFKSMLSRKYFWGEVNEYSFRIHRNINSRNSFVPHLKGQLESIDGGTKISISMNPDNAARTFLIAWSIGCVGAWVFLLYIGGLFNFGSLILPFIYCFALYGGYRGFWSEVKIAEEKLVEIFRM